MVVVGVDEGFVSVVGFVSLLLSFGFSFFSFLLFFGFSVFCVCFVGSVFCSGFVSMICGVVIVRLSYSCLYLSNAV